jgi:hypothetical protein
MEEIILKVAEYGTVAGVAMGMTFLYFKYGKNGKSNPIVEELKVTNTNHLKHIQQAVECQTRQHEKMLEVLVEIKTILRERK